MNKNIVIGFLFLMSLQLHGASAEGEIDETPCMRDLKAFEESAQYAEWKQAQQSIKIKTERAKIIVQSLEEMQAAHKQHTSDQMMNALIVGVLIKEKKLKKGFPTDYLDKLDQLILYNHQAFPEPAQIEYRDALIDYANYLNQPDVSEDETYLNKPLLNKPLKKKLTDPIKYCPNEQITRITHNPHVWLIKEWNQARRDTLGITGIIVATTSASAPCLVRAGCATLGFGLTSSLGAVLRVGLAAAVVAGGIYNSAAFHRLCSNESDISTQRTLKRSFVKAAGIGALGGASWFLGGICSSSGSGLFEGLVLTGCGALAGIALNSIGYLLNKKINDGLLLPKINVNTLDSMLLNGIRANTERQNPLLPAPRFDGNAEFLAEILNTNSLFWDRLSKMQSQAPAQA